MSTQQTKFTEIANAIRIKDGTAAPIVANDFAQRIRDLPTHRGPHNVPYVDYDGTLLKDEWVQTGGKSIPPPAPLHPFLIFKGWTHTEQELSNIQFRPSERGAEFMPGHVIVGAEYSTIDNITHIFVSPNYGGGKTVAIYLSKVESNYTATIDWGDGQIDNVNVTGNTSKSRVYSVAGNYHIKITSSDDTVYSLGAGTTATAVVTTGNAMVTKILIADNVLLRNYAFYNMSNLEAVMIPFSGLTDELGTNLLNGANSLAHITLPHGYIKIPDYFVANATGLKSAAVAWTATQLGINAFYLTPALPRLVLAPGVSEIPNSFFDNGSVSECISDPITSMGLGAFNSYYLAHHFNLAKKVDFAGGNVFTNTFYLKLHDLEVNLKGATNNMTWLQNLTGTLTVRSDAGITVCPGITNFNNISKLVIGAFTSIQAAITNKECNIYVFEGVIPPTLSSAGFINGVNKIAKIYVPDESVTAYKTATNWTGVANYIFPISQLPAAI